MSEVYISCDVHLLNVPYVGKVFSRKILANLTNGVQFTNFFLPISTDQYNKITEDLPVDLPKFYPPKFPTHSINLYFAF